jgi:type II secretory pathway pseudopilin PulG
MSNSLVRKFASRHGLQAFTLLELLVVITIIIILIGFLFPAFRGVQDQAKKTQAKNDVMQIATAINAYYTEYGKYPVVTNDTTIANTADLFYTLRAVNNGANTDNVLNPRQVVFIAPPHVKDTANPKSGIDNNGQFYDPWGPVSGRSGRGLYHIRIDGDYNNQLQNPYSADTGAGPSTLLNTGAIVWSLGADATQATSYKDSNGVQCDDVISWQ